MIQKIFISFSIIFLIFNVTFFNFSINFCDDNTENEEIIDVLAEINEPNNSSTNITQINSRSCILLERSTNTVIYGKNETIKRKIASTTKIMTAILVIENCNLNDITTISKKAAQTGGSRLGLKENDKISIQNLLYGLMLCSGNDAAVALAEFTAGNVESFCSIMNEKAKLLHLENTNFESPHGLDSENHYSTAYELALLANYALKNPTFSKIVKTKNYTITINNSPKNLSNTNELLGNFDGVYGVKTGFTNGANRCLVSCCKRGDLDVICIVLGADTKKFRTSDSIKLLNYAFNNFEMVNIGEIINNSFNDWKTDNINNFYINKAASNLENLRINSPEFNYIPLLKGTASKSKPYFYFKNYYEAPLSPDTPIGLFQLKLDNNILFSSNIYPTNTINKKDFEFYFFYFLKNYKKLITQ